MKAVIKEKISKFIVCPGCQSEDSFEITDLAAGDRLESCYCENCGTVLSGYMTNAGTCEIGVSPEKNVPTLVLIKLEASVPLNIVLLHNFSENVVPEIAGDFYQGKDYTESLEYLFNNYLPPSISLSRVVAVFKERCDEPEGVIKFRAARPFLAQNETLEDVDFIERSKEIFSPILE